MFECIKCGCKYGIDECPIIVYNCKMYGLNNQLEFKCQNNDINIKVQYTRLYCRNCWS